MVSRWRWVLLAFGSLILAAWARVEGEPTALKGAEADSTERRAVVEKAVADAPIEPRTLWTTSRVIGSPDPPPPYRSARAWPKLSFKNALYILAEPAGRATRRMFVVEQAGTIRAFSPDQSADKSDVFLKLDDHDFYGMTFHPEYAKNGFVYVFANGPNSNMEHKYNRILRFVVRSEAPHDCDLATQQMIFEYESNGHNGGDLAFGPDGMLYISSGDGTTDSDTNLTGQKISDLVSGMIRIDVEHPDPGKGYSVPKDNPFLNIPDARPELWAYGFRNPWRIHFDPAGNLWCGDIGQDQWEMVEIVKRGDNYGWSVVEGGHPFYLERTPGPHPIVKPAIVHPHSEARSITGGVTYQGSRLPELKGAYVYGDYGTGKIWSARYDGKQVFDHKEIADTPFQILGFGIDPEGEIYLVDYAGSLYTLERAPVEKASAPFPRKLSETGLYKSVAGHVVEAGLIPYDVNSPLWSDNAIKERFIALPGESQIEYVPEGAWKFPEGSVLVKSFSLEATPGDSGTRRRVETRLMLIQQNEWVGYSYRWNAEQTDAELVDAAGADQEFTIHDAGAPAETRIQKWHFPSRAECMVCHSRAAGFVLGPNVAQMNRTSASVAQSGNQLQWLADHGVFKGSEKEPFRLPKNTEELPALAAPNDAKASLEARVRSYLHSNCAQCHVDAGGGNSAMLLAFTTPTDKAKLVDVKPLHDKFGLKDARLVAPGAPERSVLLHRLSLRGRGQMPPLATSLVDQEAVALFREWIKQLPSEKATSEDK